MVTQQQHTSVSAESLLAISPTKQTIICTVSTFTRLLFEVMTTFMKNSMLQTHTNQTIIALNRTSTFLSLNLPHTGQYVSNLCFIAKILEKLVLSQVSSYLNSHNLYNTCQSAYRPGHSTETALLKVVNDLFLSLNKGNISVLALLVFSSAFDTIDHTILVHRLHTDFGFTDTVLQWFSSYLTDRTHYVSLCNHCSDFAPVHSGVPQGSVLDPILFTMYIKPLSAIIDSHSIIHHSFADDLQLQMSAPPDRISELLHSMQSCISDVKAWATANMLKLNGSKTELMLVTSKRSKRLHNLPTSITIGNAQIPFKQSVKNLGFTLDCHLTMNAHVSNIARTCYFELRHLASIRRFLTSTATATLYLLLFCQELTTVTHCCLVLLMM